MFKVLLISKSSPSSWDNVGILKRKDFNVIFENDFEEAFQRLTKEDFNLFIAEENPFDNTFLIFINQILNQLKVPTLKGILICSATKDLEEMGPFKKILFTPLEPEDLNDAIAKILNLKQRASRRYIVRMHLGIREEGTSFFTTCTTINLNKSGMLIETTKSLPIGKVYFWTFQGAKELDGLTIKGKIVNEAKMESFSLNFRYGVQFLEECIKEIKKIEEFLKEKF